MFDLLLSILLAATPPMPRSRLCVASPNSDLMSGNCVDAGENEISVEPAKITRAWVWMDAARKTVAVGTLAPGASKVVVDEKPSALLTLDGSAERDWPAPATVVVGTWKFTLPREIVSRVRAFALSDGAYDLRIEAPHHLAYERKALKMSRAKPLQLGLITLKPMPRLHGRFVDRQGGPVADVAVTTPEGTALATSDATGAIREELTAALPERLFVRASGYGHRTVEITRSEADFDFGTVTLTPGATLTIRVDRNGYDGPLTASLLRTGEHSIDGRTIFATKTIDHDASTIELRDLETRDYMLLLRGEGPLENILERVKVAENVTKDVRIEPRTVKGFVHRGSEPLANANMRFTGGNGEWSTRAKTDDQGHFRFDAWNASHVSIGIETSAQAHYSAVRMIGTNDTEWDIDIPDRRIRGVVVDKESGNPIHANVTLDFHLEQRGGMYSVPVGDDGRFEVTMVDPGRYDFTARDPAYLNATGRVEVRPEDHDREVRLEMQHGFEVRVGVLNAEGAPVAGAAVIAARGPDRMPRQWMTDPSGIATLRLASKDPLPVWIVSPADSFAVTTITPEAQDDPLRVVLPPAVATIDIKTLHQDDTPAVHAHLFFRYNGAFVPDDVREYFAHRRGRLISGSDGSMVVVRMPAGQYDFSTLETPEEHVSIDPRAPLTHVSILPGENRVTLRVTPRRK